MAAATVTIVCMRARASWDTNPSPKPSKFTNKPLKPAPTSTSQAATEPTTPATTARTRTALLEKDEFQLPQLFSSNGVGTQRGKSNNQYLGYDRWLPVAPKVKRPRSIYNAASLAYVGDCIYELYARRHFLFPPLSINEFNERVMKVVRCESQDILLKKLLDGDYVTEEERDVLRWGKNIASSKTRTTKRAGVAVYNRASSLETLIGYLYLTDVKRLEEIMLKLGFSTGASSELIAEDLRMKFQKQTLAP